MPAWCRMFQQTLDGPARGWFDRMPNGCIDNWTNLREAFVERFALRRKCCKDLTKVSKIIRKANKMLPDFKERWTEEMSYIPDVPIVMQISSFMSNSKCPELARRFSDPVLRTLTEMMKRVDDFVKLEEVFKNTELPKGEQPKRGTAAPFRGSRPPRQPYGCGPSRGDAYNRRDNYQPYVPPGKVINMVRENDKELKRKSLHKQAEEWMNGSIVFPSVSTDDVSNGPLIIEAEVDRYLVRRAFVDQGAAVQVMASSPYNIILGRTSLRELRAVSSTVYDMMKFPTPKGISTLCARAEPVYECRWSEQKVAKQEEMKEKAEEQRDAYKGYHQIQMSKEDEEKTAFYTDQGKHCYVKMPSGLKNVGATY
ncbi:reverse transcriptase domain-containing protein [Tanacetum coccineum]